MKYVVALLCTLLIACIALQSQTSSRPPASGSTFEYLTIRWGGRENTQIIRPGGKVEFVGAELRKVQKPDKADERAFYMNIVLNGLAKDGYEFVAMTDSEILLRRLAR